MAERFRRLDTIGATNSQADLNLISPRLQIDRSALAALRNGEPCPLVADFESSLDLQQSASQQNDKLQPRSEQQLYELGDSHSIRHVTSSPSNLTSRNLYVLSGDHAPARPQSSEGGTSTGNSSTDTIGNYPIIDNRPVRVANSSMSRTPDSPRRHSSESAMSAETEASSISILPPLQTKPLDETGQLEPLVEEDDPRNFELVAASDEPPVPGIYGLEKRAEQLLSKEHLEMIFADPKQLLTFTGFLNTYRPNSIPILIFYLDTLKALRAIKYANAISEALEPIQGLSFTEEAAPATHNSALSAKADRAFEVLVTEDLPAFVVHVWIHVVSTSIQRRITGTLAPHLREASEGLAEVFCLSDPSRPDNPIVFASEEFHRTTQYGMNYAIGRNCRFLQGPRTNPHSVRRIALACKMKKEHNEVFVNYRRDGSPFMNLLMVAPLFDSKGVLRYFIGAQIDVSGLLKDCTGLDCLADLVARESDPELAAEMEAATQKNEFQSLSEMFNAGEPDIVRQHGGGMHQEKVDESDRESIHRPRLLLRDSSRDAFVPSSAPTVRPATASGTSIDTGLNGKLEGVYQHYMLVRPAPSLRVLFTSPSLRVPGILQSPFLSRIGGSARVRSDLAQAMSEGRGVTAKIRWLTKANNDGEGEGRPRWIHATPLYSHSGSVGVWMVILVDDSGDQVADVRRRFRQAPPISNNIGGKEYEPGLQQRRDRERTKVDGPLRSKGSSADWQGHGSTLASKMRSQEQLHVANMGKTSQGVSRVQEASDLSFQLH